MTIKTMWTDDEISKLIKLHNEEKGKEIVDWNEAATSRAVGVDVLLENMTTVERILIGGPNTL